MKNKQFWVTLEWFPRNAGGYAERGSRNYGRRRQLLSDTENDVKNRSKAIVPVVGMRNGDEQRPIGFYYFIRFAFRTDVDVFRINFNIAIGSVIGFYTKQS